MEPDDSVVSLAAGQHGAVGRSQLRALGVDRHIEKRRVAAGRWRAVQPGVITVAGAPETPEQSLMVAVLAAGAEAVASHEAAAWLWDLPGFGPSLEVIQVRHGYRGSARHRPRLALPDHRTIVRSIPCTTLPKTLFDLAATLPLGRMARVVDAVVTRSPAMLPALHELLPVLSARGRPGLTVMRTLLDERPVGTAVPASGNEHRFEEVLHHAGIRGFERQVDVGGHSWFGRCDYVRLDIRLIAEVDSRLHHTSVTDRANDAARDAALRAAGWTVVRFWDDDLWHRPWDVVDSLRRVVTALEAQAA